jgi:hypothetical protein
MSDETDAGKEFDLSKQELVQVANRIIRVPFDPDQYNEIIQDPSSFRDHLAMHFEKSPELFPKHFGRGYLMKDIRVTKKLDLPLRRIRLNYTEITYTIHPSFIMPGCSGFTEHVSKGLFLRKSGTSFWTIAFTFGRNAMYWYRMEASLGRFSLVGTTVKDSTKLAEHLAADEKHSKISGSKTYIATTVAEGCIFGCELTENAGNESLEKGYSVFKTESLELDDKYSPTTVNLDGWRATNNAWRSLFSKAVLIPCMLHFYIKIRDGAKKKWPEAFLEVADKFWHCYRAETKSSFSQRLRRFGEWAKSADIPEFMSKRIENLQKKTSELSTPYDHPGSHRTSNMLDRLMQRMDRHLFSAQYFHGNFRSANFSIRGWSLIQNFAPYNPRTTKSKPFGSSPAEFFNGKKYSENWLENLIVSASIVTRYKLSPPKPL